MKFRPFYEADGVAAGGGEPAPAGGEPAGDTPPASVMDGLGGGEPAPAGGEPPAPNVPEQYTFNLGEGLTISNEQQTALTEIARANNLSQEAVDALLKMHSDIMLDTIRQAEDQKNQWAKQCHEQGIADKEHIGYAKRCIDTFGGSGAMQALIETGAINHPEVQRMLQRIGSMLSEDTGATGGGNPAPQQVSDEQLMFPNSKY